jgi:uncharacterized membrane protein YtjA (UPF0391 family)
VAADILISTRELSRRLMIVFSSDRWSQIMLHLVITLLIIALIAGLLGFGGIAGTAVGFAKIIFVVALVLFIVSIIFGGLRGGFGRRL